MVCDAQQSIPLFISRIVAAQRHMGAEARLEVLLAVAIAVQRGTEQAAVALVRSQQHRAAAIPEQDASSCPSSTARSGRVSVANATQSVQQSNGTCLNTSMCIICKAKMRYEKEAHPVQFAERYNGDSCAGWNN